uniref:Uncharacterized protein n=1 Tax=Romanomermis culicivorax TaxID=13658 RepID=A0A915HZ86_ROMCU
MNDLRKILIWIFWTISNFTLCRCLDWVQVKIIWLDIFAECFEHSCGETKLRFIVKGEDEVS